MFRARKQNKKFRRDLELEKRLQVDNRTGILFNRKYIETYLLEIQDALQNCPSDCYHSAQLDYNPSDLGKAYNEEIDWDEVRSDVVVYVNKMEDEKRLRPLLPQCQYSDGLRFSLVPRTREC